MWPNPQFPMQLVAFTEKAIMENFNSTVFLRISLLTHSLCEKCPNVEFFFWPVFFCIRTEYEDLRVKYSVQIQEKTDQKRFTQWFLVNSLIFRNILFSGGMKWKQWSWIY